MTKTTYKQIDLAGWEKVGEGGNGSVYTCHGQLLVEHPEEVAKRIKELFL